ncbi:MAG: MBL fold metallo-hydrolase, partial [Deltaproteobacteria bacterium]|nr:MBL fold metallo-hydrolase [Deltaproteobacteria bacterium]
QGEGPSVYHVGSADLNEAEKLGIQADVVLCCTIGRHSGRNFTQRVVNALRPTWIVPCHWDQFWRPLDAPPRQIPTNDLAGFLDEVAACDSAPQVRVLPPRGWAVFPQ